MQILSKGMKHTFCPSKLYRDYPDYVIYFETLFNSYKSSESLNNLGIEISQQTISDQNQIIKLYEQYIRIEQYDILGKMIGGSKEE